MRKIYILLTKSDTWVSHLTLSLTITRRGEDKGVERRFASLLVKLGIVPTVVEDETLRAIA